MLIDFLTGILLVLAVIKGYQRGLIAGVFSLVAVIVGLAAALKLSAAVAGYLGQSVKISERWLPLISFILVFLAVVLLIRLGANFIQRTVELAMLGWVNRLGGILFYAAIYLLVYSVLLFFATQMSIIKPATMEQSVTYAYISPWGPRVINGLGQVIPLFKDVFSDLESFFGNLSREIAP